MRTLRRYLGAIVIIAVVAGAYYIGRAGKNDNGDNAASGVPPDPGYAARDAQVIETGYDGRERYRLNAKVISQRIDSNVIELETLAMDYHPGAQGDIPGETKPSAAADETWHLTSDRGQVRADGDDVQLHGNVVVTGQAPGSKDPLTLRTESMSINTPTQFIETREPVRIRWAGHELVARGMQADLKAGTLRLESEVHGSSSNK